jgi:hypothetical protein
MRSFVSNNIYNAVHLASICLAAVLATVGHATTWYVDSVATGSRNGTSWANAWTSLDQITGIVAGDTVYISGGQTSLSQTYTVPSGGWNPAGGTAGNPVTYQTGQDAAHNGTVKIDGGGGQWLLMPQSGNFTISGYVAGVSLNPTGPPNGLTDLNPHMVFQNNQDAEVFLNYQANANIHLDHISAPAHDRFIYCVNGTNITGLVVSYCYLRKVPDASAINAISSSNDDTMFLGGLGGSGFASGAEIHHCYILNVLSTGNSAYGDDVFKWGQNFDVHHCHLATYQDSRYKAQEPNQHSDIFQVGDSNIRAYSNWFENIGESVFFHDNFGSTSGQFHDIYIYNNVVTQSYVQPYAQVDRGLDFEPQDTQQADTFTRVIVANNIFSGLSNLFCMRFHQAASWTDCHVTNNVYLNCLGGLVATDSIAPSEIQIDHNLAGSVSDFVNAGGKDFHSNAGAPEIDSGSNFPSAYFTTDKDGVPRPQGAGWDVGPYERSQNPTPTP